MTTESIAVRDGAGTVQQSNVGGEINFPAMMAQADVLIKSGFLPQAIKTPAQAVAIMLTGRELGIPTMQALRQINVIQGKPTMAAELMLALAYQRIPGFRYAVVKSTAQECVCQFERPGHKPYQHTFTMQDADALGLAGKQNWHTQPATMLRWRCISSGLRLVAPDAIAGVYTPEELMPDAKVNFDTGAVERIPEPLSASVATPVPAMPPAKAEPDAAHIPPAPPVNGSVTVEVVLGEVKEKKGKSAKGPWTRTYAQADDGEYYSTFDTKLGQFMHDLQGGEALLTYVIEQTPKGESRKVIAVRPVAEPELPPDPDASGSTGSDGTVVDGTGGTLPF